jgi:hypothetical protein
VITIVTPIAQFAQSAPLVDESKNPLRGEKGKKAMNGSLDC